MLNNPLPRTNDALRQQIKEAFDNDKHNELLALVKDNGIYKEGCATCGENPKHHLRSWVAYLIAYNFEPPNYKLYDSTAN